MNFGVGKFYKTRCGLKAIVYAIWPENPQLSAMHGAVRNTGNIWENCTWRATGLFCVEGEAPYDLIEKWEDPKPKLVAWLVSAQNGAHRNFVTFSLPGGNLGLLHDEHATRVPWLDET